MDNNQAMREFLREKVNKDIVLKYLFIKQMEKNYDDEYLERKYRINVSGIRKMYASMNKHERENMENNIRDQISAGEIDLSKEVVKWHREELKRDYIKRTKINSNNEKREEH